MANTVSSRNLGDFLLDVAIPSSSLGRFFNPFGDISNRTNRFLANDAMSSVLRGNAIKGAKTESSISKFLRKAGVHTSVGNDATFLEIP